MTSNPASAMIPDRSAAHRIGECFPLTLLGQRREEVGRMRWSDLAF